MLKLDRVRVVLSIFVGGIECVWMFLCRCCILVCRFFVECVLMLCSIGMNRLFGVFMVIFRLSCLCSFSDNEVLLN